jgi:hypothetical protein
MRVIAPPFDLREIVAASASDLLRSLAELRTSIRRRWSLRRELQLVLAHLALRIAIRLLRGSLRSGRNRGSDFVPLTSAGPRFPWTKDELAALEGFGKPVVCRLGNEFQQTKERHLGRFGPVIPNAGQPLLRAGSSRFAEILIADLIHRAEEQGCKLHLSTNRLVTPDGWRQIRYFSIPQIALALISRGTKTTSTCWHRKSMLQDGDSKLPCPSPPFQTERPLRGRSEREGNVCYPFCYPTG